MKRSALQIALAKYQSAHCCWKQIVAERKQLRDAAGELYERHWGDPHIHDATDLEKHFPALISNAQVKADIRDEARELWKALQDCVARFSVADAELARTRSTLSELVQKARSRQADLYTTRWTTMSREVVELLTPYCASQQEAKEISRQCGKLAAIEFEIDQFRSGMPDPQIAAERLILLEQDVNAAPKAAKTTL